MTVRGPEGFTRDWRDVLASWDAAQGTARVWKRDAALWTGGDEAAWLGWLVAPDTPVHELRSLEARLAAAVPDDANEVLLIGMGGSSLAAEVVAQIAPRQPGARVVRILDSTEPTAVRAALDATDWARTMIVVASKSGSTLEPGLLFVTALEEARRALGEAAARHVVVITDPGSALEADAVRIGVAAVVHGEPTIGGRYSALSPFGLVPAALQGTSLPEFLESARSMAAACRLPAGANPGVQLGAFLACAARAGRDKCTLLMPGVLAPLGAWIEQLVAESTGKNGIAVLPIDGEPLGDPAAYGADRAFVRVRGAGGVSDDVVDALIAVGHPVFSIDDASPATLAGEFFRWEFATAVAGAVLGVHPFDQPDVEASKVATRALTESFERDGVVPQAAGAGPDLRTVLSGVATPAYVALLAYLPMTAEAVRALQVTRLRIRDARGVATSLGFGPRYLHSTGQAFKGGPPTGVFVQLTCDAPEDVPVPGRRLTFGAVVAAQAAGDRQVLRDRGRPVAHVHLSGDLDAALRRFDAEVAASLA